MILTVNPFLREKGVDVATQLVRGMVISQAGNGPSIDVSSPRTLTFILLPNLIAKPWLISRTYGPPVIELSRIRPGDQVASLSSPRHQSHFLAKPLPTAHTVPAPPLIPTKLLASLLHLTRLYTCLASDRILQILRVHPQQAQFDSPAKSQPMLWGEGRRCGRRVSFLA